MSFKSINSSLALSIVASLGFSSHAVHAEDFEVAKAAPTAPVQDDLSGKIAFIVQNGAGANATSYLMVSDVTGENPTPIATIKGIVKTLSASANGRQLAFTAAPVNNYPLIYTADAYTPNSVQLVTPEKANHSGASISPDGSQLLYSSGAGSSSMDIFLASVGGGNPRRIINHPAADTAPSWSPDGTGFIFSSDRGGGNNNPRLYRYNLATGATQALGIGGGYAADGHYSSDGKKITYSTFSQGAVADVGGGSRVVSSVAEAPSMSPNGQNIVYASGNGYVVITPSKKMTVNPLANTNIRGKILRPVWLKAQS